MFSVKFTNTGINQGDYILLTNNAIDNIYEYVTPIINYIGHPKELQMDKKHQYAYINKLLKNDFLPNVGKSFKKKAIFLGYMTARLLNCFIGREDYDDRDNYINKRIDLPGILLGNLFRQYFSKLVKDMRNAIMKEFNSGLWKCSKNYTNIIKDKSPVGIPINIPSNLSSTPPCPGNILPVSFNFAFLFKNEKNKSPA